jgi:hypothetical protein
VDEAGDGVAVELAGDDADLGHVLDRPAILARADLQKKSAKLRYELRLH